MEIEHYLRKSFPVEVVAVNQYNMREVASWCEGELGQGKKMPEAPDTQDCIFVPVVNPHNERQTMAFPGDRILKSEVGFKVYSERAFHNSFEADEDGPTRNVFDQEDARKIDAAAHRGSFSTPKPGPHNSRGGFPSSGNRTNFPHVSRPRE